MTNSKFKKGDVVYIVSVSHGDGLTWPQDMSLDPIVRCSNFSSEGFRTVVHYEQVTLTSYGKVQGTAVTTKGNLMRRIHVGHTTIMRTVDEIESLRASIGLGPAADSIAKNIKWNKEWYQEYVVDSSKGHPHGIRRNNFGDARLAECSALEPIKREWVS